MINQQANRTNFWPWLILILLTLAQVCAQVAILNYEEVIAVQKQTISIYEQAREQQIVEELTR